MKSTVITGTQIPTEHNANTHNNSDKQNKNNTTTLSSSTTNTTTTTTTTNNRLRAFINANNNKSLTKEKAQELSAIITAEVNSKEKLIKLLKSKDLIKKLFTKNKLYTIPVLTLYNSPHFNQLKREEWAELIKCVPTINTLCAVYLLQKAKAKSLALSTLLAHKNIFSILTKDDWRRIISDGNCFLHIIAVASLKINAPLQSLLDSTYLESLPKDEWKKIILYRFNLIQILRSPNMQLRKVLVNSGCLNNLTKEACNYIQLKNPQLLSHLTMCYNDGCNYKGLQYLKKPLLCFLNTKAILNWTNNQWNSTISSHPKTFQHALTIILRRKNNDHAMRLLANIITDKEVFKHLTKELWVKILAQDVSLLAFIIDTANQFNFYPQIEALINSQAVAATLTQQKLKINTGKKLIKKLILKTQQAGILLQKKNNTILGQQDKRKNEKIDRLLKTYFKHIDMLMQLGILQLVPIDTLNPVYAMVYDQYSAHWKPNTIKLQQKILEAIRQKKK